MRTTRMAVGFGVVMALAGCASPEAPEPQAATLQQGLAGGDVLWRKQLGGSGQEQGHAVAFDRDGNVLMLVDYQGSVDLGSGPVGSGDANHLGFAVAKYTSAGALLWTRHFEGVPQPGVPATYASALALTVDRERNVLVGATSQQPIDLGGGVQPPGGLLLKLSQAGQFRWARHFTGSVLPRHLVTDSRDAVALAGNLNGPADFGQGPIPAPVGLPTAFLTKFSASGATQWTFADAGSSPDSSSGVSVAVDEEDALYLAGQSRFDPVVWKLGPAGAVAWTRYAPGAYGGALNVAVHGNRVVAVGQFNNDFPFAGGTVSTPSTGNGGFVVAWTRAGEQRWARGLGGGVSAVAMAEDDSVVVAGNYTSGNDLGDGPAPGGPGYNLFVAHLERLQGDRQWVRTFPATGQPRVADLAVNKQGEFVALGHFAGALDLGGPYVSRGAEDVFLFKAVSTP